MHNSSVVNPALGYFALLSDVFCGSMGEISPYRLRGDDLRYKEYGSMRQVSFALRTLLPALSLTLFCACGAGEGSGAFTPTPSPAPSPQTSGYASVLLEGAPFFDMDSQEETTLASLLETYSAGWAQVEVSQFAVVDLDGGGPEVLLRLAAGSDSAYGFEVLRETEGQVLGYSFTYRNFGAIKTDGSFFVSGGADDYGVGVLRFEGDTWSIQRTASCERTVGEEGEEVLSYFVDGASAGEDAYQAAYEAQKAKEDVLWRPFTPEEVEAALAEI